MPTNKMSMETKGLDELLARIDGAGGDMKEAVTKALVEAKEAVTPEIESAIRAHRRTGNTEASLDTDMTVDWAGPYGSIDIGFHIRQGGLPSIFLMYGTPRIQPDKKLYDSIYGAKTRKKAQEAQQKALQEFLAKIAGG